MPIGPSHGRTRALATIVAFAAAFVTATGAAILAAGASVGLTVNGGSVALPGLAIESEVVVGSAKDFLELFGEDVATTPDGRALRAFGHSVALTLVAGQPYLYTPGKVELAVAPRVDEHGRLIAPLAPLAEALGFQVVWRDDTKTLVVTDPDASEVAPPPPKPRIPFTDDDLLLIARVVYSEAPDEPFEGQVGVAAVVVNRVLSPHFPDTVHDVVFAPGQFQGTKTALFRRDPSDEALRAAKAALYGEDPTDGALYFYDPRTATSKWIRTLKVLVTIGHHAFATDPRWAATSSQ